MALAGPPDPKLLMEQQPVHLPELLQGRVLLSKYYSCEMALCP